LLHNACTHSDEAQGRIFVVDPPCGLSCFCCRYPAFIEKELSTVCIKPVKLWGPDQASDLLDDDDGDDVVVVDDDDDSDHDDDDGELDDDHDDDLDDAGEARAVWGEEGGGLLRHAVLLRAADWPGQ
jgi:hypothetical protein